VKKRKTLNSTGFSQFGLGIDKQKGQITGEADIERARIGRFLNRHAGVKRGQLKIVGQTFSRLASASRTAFPDRERGSQNLLSAKPL